MVWDLLTLAGPGGGRSAAAAGSHCAHEAYAAGAALAAVCCWCFSSAACLRLIPPIRLPTKRLLPRGPWLAVGWEPLSWQAVQAGALLLLLMWQPVAARGPFWQLLLTRGFMCCCTLPPPGLVTHACSNGCRVAVDLPHCCVSLLRVAAGRELLVLVGPCRREHRRWQWFVDRVWHQLVLYRRVWLQVQGEMLPRLVLHSVASLSPPACPPARKLVAAGPFLRRISRSFESHPGMGSAAAEPGPARPELCCRQPASCMPVGTAWQPCGAQCAPAAARCCLALLPSAAPGAGGPSFWPCLQPRRHTHHCAT